MKRVTIRDVAARAGVSSSTVSRALNDLPTVSDATKAAVREACRALDYVPDMTARSLSGHNSYTLGVIVPDISNPYFSALCTAIEGCAAQRGYRVMLTNTLHDPDYELAAIEQMLAQRVDGLVISAYSPQSQMGHAALIGDLPCVYIGCNHGPACSFVEADNRRGAYEAAQYLYRLGHRDIVFLGGRQGSETLAQRLEGYRRSMAQNGLSPVEITAPDGTTGLRKWCFRQALALFESGPVPDAIIAYSDIIAMQILDAAGAHGLAAPRDFSILGFDNTAFGRLPQIHLTSVSQRKFTAGRLAVERLLAQLEQGGPPAADVLAPELMVRSSCRKAQRKESFQ